MSESLSSSTVTSTASLPMPTTGTAAPRTTRTIHKQDPATEEEKKTETETDTDVRWMGPLPEESASARQHGDYCSGMPGLSGIPTRRRGRKSSTVSNCIVGNTDSVTSHQHRLLLPNSVTWITIQHTRPNARVATLAKEESV